MGMEQYRRLKIIGKGAFGAAILVHARGNPTEQYVVKQVDVSRLKPKERDEAKKEIKLLASFHHPNIVRYRDSFIETGVLHIVMDYAEGGDLSNLLKERGARLMAEEQILDYFVQLCLAMKHVHDRKVLHRDIKSQNLFLTQNRKVLKLGDFGIARVLNATTELARTACGTPYYMSPEICDNKPYNDKSDVWSMGCLLYEMATLRCPFDARDMRGLIIKILRGTYQPLPRNFTEGLTNLVGICLARQPAQRPSVNELLAMPVVRKRIERFLSEAEHHSEFSHTVMHRNPAKNKPHPAAPLPAPTAASPAMLSIPPSADGDVTTLESRARTEAQRREEQRARDEAQRLAKQRHAQGLAARAAAEKRLAEESREREQRANARRARELEERKAREAREMEARHDREALQARRNEEARKRGEIAERRMREERRAREEEARRMRDEDEQVAASNARNARAAALPRHDQRAVRPGNGRRSEDLTGISLGNDHGYDIVVSPEYERMQRQRRLLQARREELARDRKAEEEAVSDRRREYEHRDAARAAARAEHEARRRLDVRNAFGSDLQGGDIQSQPMPYGMAIGQRREQQMGHATPVQPELPAGHVHMDGAETKAWTHLNAALDHVPHARQYRQPAAALPIAPRHDGGRAGEVLAARDVRRRQELAAQEEAARIAGRRVWQENQAAAARNRRAVLDSDVPPQQLNDEPPPLYSPQAPGIKPAPAAIEISAEQRRKEYMEARAAAERNRRRALDEGSHQICIDNAKEDICMRRMPGGATNSETPAEITSAMRRQQYQDAKAAADRNRQRVLDEVSSAADAAEDSADRSTVDAAIPSVKLPDALARKLDRRHSDRQLHLEQQRKTADEESSALKVRPSAALPEIASIRRDQITTHTRESDGAKLEAIREWIAADSARLVAARYASVAASAAAEGLTELALDSSSAVTPQGSTAVACDAGQGHAERAETVLLPGGTLKLGQTCRCDGDKTEAPHREAHFHGHVLTDAEAEQTAVEREAAAYGELLETLQELVHNTPSKDPVSVDQRSATTENCGKNDTSKIDSTADEDLLAAGVMSGVEHAPIRPQDDFGQGSGELAHSAESLRELLKKSLGDDAFERAHSRLQNVVEEEDDDALVADIQAILGPSRLNQLPMILKLIYLEGGGAL